MLCHAAPDAVVLTLAYSGEVTQAIDGRRVEAFELFQGLLPRFR